MLISFVIAGLMAWTVRSPVMAVVTIENNGYRGLVVAIHENVTEDIRIIENIKAMLIKASPYLHRVTRQRAFFEEVTIVVPSSWSPRPEYLTVHGGGELFGKAEVRVDAPNPMYGDEPYTLQPGECGDAGQYIHLTPDFLVGEDTELPTSESEFDDQHNSNVNPNVNERKTSMFSVYGDLGPVFVHEFAHLRYGVFDEHGVQGDEKTPRFYKDDLGKIRPTGCPSGIRGLLGDANGRRCRSGWDGLPDDQCLFYPDLNRKSFGRDGVPVHPTKVSIMYMPGIELSDGFCDDDSNDRRHNPIAPNKHNLMCQGRSTWDVVSNHADFTGTRNTARDVNNMEPRFRVIRPRDFRHQTVLLVLDLSSSMRGNRMKLLHLAVTRLIKYELTAGQSTLGIIGFSDNARVITDMTDLTEANRDELIRRVPEKDDSGYTAIGSGILKGLQILRNNGKTTEGSRLVLVSDGEENRKPHIEETLDEVRKAGVIVTTVALGKQASEKLELLVRATGGNGYFYDDHQVGTSITGLDASFAAAVTVNAPVELQPVEIGNRNISLRAKESYQNSFHVDKEVGKDTLFRVVYGTGAANGLEVILVSPTGQNFDSKSTEYRSDVSMQTIVFNIAQAEPGKWTYTITNTGTEGIKLTLTISSEAKDHRDQPIRIRSWINDIEFTHPARVKVYAEVKKGYAAIFDATVTAIIYRPDNDPHLIRLLDDGVGADTTANDGIYSNYFTKFDGSGRYSVEANVLNDGHARLSLGNGRHTTITSTAPIVPVLPAGVNKKDLGTPDSYFSPDQLLEARRPDNRNVVNESNSLDNFERFTTAGSFRLNKWQNNDDLIPPSRVIDLRTVDANLTTRIVHLVWTAVGDNLMEDIANDTDIRFNVDPFYLLRFFNRSRRATDDMLINGSSLLPPEPQTAHNIFVTFPSEDELFLNESNYRVFFALRTIDKAGNKADISNLALVQFDEPSQFTPLQTFDKKPSTTNLWIIIILVVLGIVICCCVLIAIWTIRRRSKKEIMWTDSDQRSNACITNEL